MKNLMFRLVVLPFVVCFTLAWFVGCPKTTTAPLPTGAVDATDAAANSVLQPAHAFALDLTDAVLSTDPAVHINLTPAQKLVLIDMNKALNYASALEIAYHDGATPAGASALNAAVATVESDLASAKTLLPEVAPSTAAAKK